LNGVAIIWNIKYIIFDLCDTEIDICIILATLGTDHLTWRWRGGLWFFVSFRIFFSDNTRVRIFYFFYRGLIVHHQRYRPCDSKVGNQSFIIEYKTNAIKENRISLSINTRQNPIFHFKLKERWFYCCYHKIVFNRSIKSISSMISPTHLSLCFSTGMVY
jgi:hypothetical protein